MSRARQLRKLAVTLPAAPAAIPRYVHVALAAAAQLLASRSRPLTPGAPAEEDDAHWDAETDALIAARDRHLSKWSHAERRMVPSVDRAEQEAALAYLRNHPEARTRAAKRVRLQYGAGVFPLRIHVWGNGWRDIPAVDLSILDADMGVIETEHGHVEGVDLGWISDDSSTPWIPENRTRFDEKRAALVESTPGWEVHCHSMTSSGAPVCRYYLARRSPLVEPAGLK